MCACVCVLVVVKYVKKWIEQVKRTRDHWIGPSENSSLCSSFILQEENKMNVLLVQHTS